MSTKEGASWTPTGGFASGLPTLGAIHPQQRLITDKPDVIVVGAGYAGLVAARDLVTQGSLLILPTSPMSSKLLLTPPAGFKVTLLEARDRIGGRTYTANVNGFSYEMGGSWIHWHQPHVYREISLYRMEGQLVPTPYQGDDEVSRCSIRVGGNCYDVSPEEQDQLLRTAWAVFCDVDGMGMRQILPYPHHPLFHRDKLRRLDHNCATRLHEIRHRLTPSQMGVLQAFLTHIGGGDMTQMGFLDALQWWALGGYEKQSLSEYGLVNKLRCGQSMLARRLFDDAASTGRLSYSFCSPVSSLATSDRGVTATCVRSKANDEEDNVQCWEARYLVCSIPLNVLSDVEISPPLAPTRSAAITRGHANTTEKIHVDVDQSSLAAWSSFMFPGKGITCAFGDNLTPRGDAHLLAFGTASGLRRLTPDQGNAGATHVREALHLPEAVQIRQLLHHDWTNDPYAKGSWCFGRPGYMLQDLIHLQAPHGRIHFANSDWADGWRGWIDGAVEQGTRAARDIARALRFGDSPTPPSFGQAGSRL